MKKHIMIIALGMALTVAGCSSGTNSASSSTTNTTSQSVITNVDTATVQKLDLTDPSIQLIDVRTPDEYKAGHIAEAKLIPLQELPNRLSEIDKTKKVYVICHSGNRSSQASQILKENGFTNIYNIQGGMMKWQGKVVTE